ncbi:DUF2785 domain-containing protein [Thalassobacillus pellis]|uniref:DUF2785 domain-containing protein n=1 Tax=Thalassobacillus pellis TaxID=748008 RepID=UPI001960A53B|nr:DUF2785 domain-containing protein [Thalassobacillus pellis]MBM7554067.1 hypothetical protein [Thalassobacillus pellis]
MEERIIGTLQGVKDKNYEIHDSYSLPDLTTMMLQRIGSTDPELRNGLIHNIFTTFIERKYYNHEQMRNILKSILNKNYLFYRIHFSSQEEDAVFKRSYSMLLLPPIMEQHKLEPFLTTKEIHQIWSDLKRYLQQERDHRGYIPGKGWAHAIAHAADAVAAVVDCEEITVTEVKDMLPVIREQFLIDSPYLHDEEERMVTAIMKMFEKIEENEKVEWLETLLHKRESWDDPKEDIIINNCKHLLRSMYFRSLYGDHRQLTLVLERLLRTLRKEEAY